MQFRKFNQDGLTAFDRFLRNIKLPVDQFTESERLALLEHPDYTEPVGDQDGRRRITDLSENDWLNMETKRDFAVWAYKKLNDADSRKSAAIYRRDAGVWSWLALFGFYRLLGSEKDALSLGSIARWKLDRKWTRYYRHFLAEPFFLYVAYYDNPDAVRMFLDEPLGGHSEADEQFCARQPFISNRAYVEVATRLYFDPDKQNKLKRGAATHASGRKGVPARLVKFVDRLALNYYLTEELDADRLYKMLPPEFDGFKN